MRFLMVAVVALFGFACGGIDCEVGEETVGFADCEELQTALEEANTQEERADLLMCHAEECE
jgi:hypothetical protein